MASSKNDNKKEEAPPPEEAECKCQKGAPAWMCTFSDLMCLLLCFFVLLLSFSNMDPMRFKVVSGSLDKAFGIQRDTVVWERPEGTTPVFDSFVGSRGFDVLMNQLQTVVHSQAEGEHIGAGKVQIELFEDYRGIVLRMWYGEMFHPGKADVRPAVWPFLDDVIETLKSHGDDVNIGVEAHTDSAPIRSKSFPSNWHLSAARSVSVAEYFMRAGGIDPIRVSAIGKGDSTPLVPNTTPQARARNRRVEIVLNKNAKIKK